MSRKTFQIIISLVGLVVLAGVLTPNLIDYFNQPQEEETVVGYGSDAVFAIVDSIIEEGQITLGEVRQPYQIQKTRSVSWKGRSLQ